MAAAQYYQEVQQAYLAYYGRPADTAGLAYWANQLNNAGGDLNSIINAFGTSAESTALYGGSNTAAQVTAIYHTLFGRLPDTAGLNFYVNGIATGQFTLASVALNVYYGATGADATALGAKLAYAVAFTDALGQSASAQVAYSGTAASNNARAAVFAVVDTTSEAAAAANMSTTLTNIGSGTVGQSVTLTTGVDNIQATGGNAVINGVFGTGAGFTIGANDTLNPLDSISATGSNNTLNIVNQGSEGASVPSINISGVQTANIASAVGVTVNTTGWTGLNNLNITASTGADVVKAAGTTAVNVTNTLATGVAPAATTIDGGSTVTATVTGTNATGSAAIGNVTVGGTTAATGAVNLTVTETAAVAGTFGNVAATGAAAVTVNSTENVAVMAGTTAGTVSATGGTGAVVVTSTTNITEIDNPVTASGAFTTGAISAKGGSSIVVNSNVTASSAALAAELGAGHTMTVTQGGVTVQDGGTATSVTVNQAAPVVAKAGVAATLATAGTPAQAGIGYDAAAAVAGTPATAVVPATLGVNAGAVTISGTTGTAAGNASQTITDVTLANYAGGAGADYINSDVLKNVTLSGSGTGGLTIFNQGGNSFTSLNLNLNQFADTTGVAISGNGVTTLNVTTGGAGGSTLGAINDSSLATLNVAGTQTLKLSLPTGVADAALKAIVVSGAAGFNDNGGSFAGTAAGTTLTTTSSGTITATLHAAGTDTFTGSTGQDVITLTGDQTKAVAAGSASNDELVLANAAASTFLGAGTHVAANVSGFEVLGINNAAADGTYDMSLLSTGNSFNAIDVISGTGTTAMFANVAKNTSLAFDATNTTANAFVYQSADAQSVTGNDSVNLTLGTTAVTGGAITLGNAVGDTGATAATSSLLMEDTNQVGIATLNITSNGNAADVTAHNVNTIVALADSGLSALNVSGAVGLTIGVLNEGVTAGASATAATSFTINNTSAGAVTIGAFTDSALGTLTFTGSHNSSITSLDGVTGQVLSVSNTGTGTATIGTGFADANLKSLTLSGSVALGADVGAAGVATTQEAASFGRSGFTLSAGTDNAHININLLGANAGFTDSLTVGNGNNYITDGSTAGSVNVTVGTGSNLIDVHAGTGAGAYNITLGAHTATTGSDSILVSEIGAGAQATAGTYAANTVITGAVAGDLITFTDAAAVITPVTLTAAQTTTFAGETTLNNAIAYAHTLTGAHGAVAFQFGGNTYVVEDAVAATPAATSSVVELAGVHTIGATAVNGQIHLLS